MSSRLAIYRHIGRACDVGEHLTLSPDIHIFWSSFDMQLVSSFVAAPTVFGDLTTDPALAVATFSAVTPSTQDVFFGWSDCTGLPSNTTGCAVTNLGASRPANSNHLDFAIIGAVPEPGSLSLLGASLLALGMIHMRSRRKDA